MRLSISFTSTTTTKPTTELLDSHPVNKITGTQSHESPSRKQTFQRYGQSGHNRRSEDIGFTFFSGFPHPRLRRTDT